MTNLNIPNPVTFYSAYGYIQVNKNEFSDENMTMIPFVKSSQNMTGKIKVKL